jgi:hypothetical protein
MWLKGEKSGQAESFVDNLPGGPDNIRLGSDGSFWIAILPVSLPATGSSRSPISSCKKKHPLTGFSFQDAGEVAVAGLSPPLDIDEEGRRFVPCAPGVEQGDGEGSDGGSGFGRRQDRPVARRL